MKGLAGSFGERGQWLGPIARLGSYAWAYAAQFLLTLALGLEAFSAYVTATALAMLLAYCSMAGVSDILTRKWGGLAESPDRIASAMRNLVLPRLIITFMICGTASSLILDYGFMGYEGDHRLWLFIALFGVLAVSIDIAGALLACLGRPSVHAIASNGLLGAAFFAGAVYAWLTGEVSVNIIALHIVAQSTALVLVGRSLWLALRAHYEDADTHKVKLASNGRDDASVTVTFVHIFEIFRSHLPVLMLQAAFQSAGAVAALITSLRFSRAADVMSVLAIAQFTKRIVSGGNVISGHAAIRRLCLVFTSFALIPLGVMIGFLCTNSGLTWGTSFLITCLVLTSAGLRQFIAVELWMAKIVFNPAGALKASAITEATRLALFLAVSSTGNVFASVATFIFSDVILLAFTLRVTSKYRTA